MTGVRVVVADDDLLVRAGVVAVLETINAVEVVEQAGSLTELQAAVDRAEPDVVVTDIRMPPTMSDEGVQVVRWLRARHESGSPFIGVV